MTNKNSYSPLRYPGGKTKIYPVIKNMLPKNKKIAYAEVFAGGVGAGLKLLLNGDIEKLYINDLDINIYSLWHSILYNNQAFIKKIKDTNIDLNNWKQQKEIIKNNKKYDYLTLGFASFFLNRTNFSGVIKGGPIGGIKQSGKYKIDCRFNKQNLIKKIENIYKYKNKIFIFNLDGIDFIKYLNTLEETIFVYLDPPYYKKANSLYMSFFNDEKHIQLKEAIKILKHKWLLSYDDEEFIVKLYQEFTKNYFHLQYNIYNKRKSNELLITH